MGRRAWYFFFSLIMLSYIGWGQAVSGSWSGKIALLPSPPSFVYTNLELNFRLTDEWAIGGIADFLGADGWVWQEVTLSGPIGFVNSKLTMLFGPLATPIPALLYGRFTNEFNIFGLDILLGGAAVGPNMPPGYLSGGPSGGAVARIKHSIGDLEYMVTLGFGAILRPFTITYTGVGTYTKTYDIDPFPGGFRFTYLKVEVNDVPFICCDITMDITFSFTKDAGFDYLEFTIENLFALCCDIDFDVTVTFTTEAKQVSVDASWPGIEGCLTVYGDVQFTNNVVEGLELYGVKIFCELADCYGVEFLTAFNVAAVEDILEEDIFKDDEFEYVKLTVCGPACCGGTWNLSITAFFQRTSGPLFGLSRFLFVSEVPLLDSFTITSELEISVPGGPSLNVGWEFSF